MPPHDPLAQYARPRAADGKWTTLPLTSAPAAPFEGTMPANPRALRRARKASTTFSHRRPPIGNDDYPECCGAGFGHVLDAGPAEVAALAVFSFQAGGHPVPATS